MAAQLAFGTSVPGARVALAMVPDGGNQPQVAVEAGSGCAMVHVAYLRGEVAEGDLF